jgi:hypothetical protein
MSQLSQNKQLLKLQIQCELPSFFILFRVVFIYYSECSKFELGLIDIIVFAFCLMREMTIFKDTLLHS